MSLTFAQHQKTYSIRLLVQLKSPPLHMVSLFNLPRNSALHFIDYGTDDKGIDATSFLLANQKYDIAVEFVVKHNHELEGKAINHSYNPNEDIVSYFQANKRFKRLDKQPMLDRNERILTVYNYNLLNYVAAYPKLPQSTIHRYRNDLLTILGQCVSLMSENNRQHYICMDVLNKLPPVSILQKSADMTEQAVMRTFFNYANYQIAEMWNWLSHNRDHSVFKMLNVEQLSRINIILVHGSLWGVINLGVLNNWRFTDPKERKGPGITRIDPDTLSKRYLRMLMVISETTTSVPDDEHYTDIDKEIDTPSATDDDSEGDDNGEEQVISSRDIDVSFTGGKTAPTGQYINRTPTQSLVSLINQGVNEDTLKTDKEIAEEIGETDDNVVDNDLAALDRLEETDEPVDMGDYKAYTPPDSNLESGVLNAAMDSVRRGRLSAAEYRRYERLASRYKDIKNPFNPDQKLSDLINIDPELLKLEEDNLLAKDIKGVADKSMLSSSINVMDKRYIKEVLHKDVASMVVNLQKMGFAVQDYNVERIEDYTDNLEIHTVKIVPVTGKPTTLRFKLPVVNEAGTFKASGVKYRMRKQRGD